MFYSLEKPEGTPFDITFECQAPYRRTWAGKNDGGERKGGSETVVENGRRSVSVSPVL